jgi:mono/diheme cytochrome c family protein
MTAPRHKRGPGGVEQGVRASNHGLLKGLLLGAVGVVAVGAGAFYLVAAAGYFPANADAKPPALEKWIAHKALDAAIVRQAPKGPNPVPLDDANLIAGIRLYAADCAVCHGAADAKPSPIALGLYQKAPQLAKYGVEDDEEGETYWKLYHGIRMTGMPAFRDSLTEDELWKVVLFLKHMDSLPPAPQKAWDAVPSAAALPRRNS